MHLTDCEVGVMQVEFMDPSGNRRKATVISDWIPATDDLLQERLHAISNFYASLGCQITSIAKLESMASELKPRPRTRLLAVK
jgi:hypothetical protein